jgi:hypothetical protein
MPEWEISSYYRAKGVQFIKNHPGAALALMAGHMVRTFRPTGGVPPEFPARFQYVQWLASLALYIAALACLRLGRLQPSNCWYSLLLGGVIAVSATTAALFYAPGDRYIYQLTVLLIPMVCSGLGPPQGRRKTASLLRLERDAVELPEPLPAHLSAPAAGEFVPNPSPALQ